MIINKYVDFVINDDNTTFSINETPEKPTGQSAALTLSKIEKILRENLTYKPGTEGPFYNSDEVITNLKIKFDEIVNSLDSEKIKNLNWISRLKIELFFKEQELDGINAKIQSYVRIIPLQDPPSPAIPAGTKVDKLPTAISDPLGKSPKADGRDCDGNSEKSSSESTRGDFSTHSSSVACEPAGIAAPSPLQDPSSSLFDILPNELTTKIIESLSSADLSAFAITSQKGRLFARVEQAKRNGYTEYDLDGALEYLNNLFNVAKKKALNCIQKDYHALKHASEALRNDREFILDAVQQNSCALYYASEALRGDKDVVMAAVQQNGHALYYASEALRNDREFIMAAVKENAYMLEYAGNQLCNDREFVLAAVQEDGKALLHASEALRNDREFVLAAVRMNGLALQYAIKEFKKNRAIIIAAVQQNGRALQYASDALCGDKDVVMAAVQQNGHALYFASKELRGEREIVMAAVQQNSHALQSASDALRNEFLRLYRGFSISTIRA